MFIGVFVIIGIGCDDIFVFCDAWKQSRYEHPRISGSRETRFAWVCLPFLCDCRALGCTWVNSPAAFPTIQCLWFVPLPLTAGVPALCDCDARDIDNHLFRFRCCRRTAGVGHAQPCGLQCEVIDCWIACSH